MGITYVDFFLDDQEDCNVELREVIESGRYTIRIGGIRLAIHGELEDLNDLGFEIFHQTNRERAKKARELAVVEEVLNETSQV